MNGWGRLVQDERIGLPVQDERIFAFPAHSSTFHQNCPFSKNRKKLFIYLVDIIFSGLITSGQFPGGDFGR